ncbi:UNVERIFIED_CONTAM: Transcriptional adapter ADA2b [Sesamum angustifolium]|uniref:Transcriptional adapter ADA2b n=1 Tax=Sesamum angustifolium TaxID=2727405 RepID=A0AAW2KUR8_9LAMI
MLLSATLVTTTSRGLKYLAWEYGLMLLSMLEKTEEACIEHYTNAYLYLLISLCRLKRNSWRWLKGIVREKKGKFSRNLQLPPQESGERKVFLINVAQAMLEHLLNFCTIVSRIEDSHQSGPSRRLPSTPTPGGYNPKRHELDIEYDNDADELLVDMEFKESDDEWERGLKLKNIELMRETGGNQRKDFIIERGLLHPRPFERDLSKEERRKCQHYDVFLRLHSKEEHEELLKCVISVHRTLKRLQELKEARAAGCRSVAEADRYIEQKKQRLSEDGDHWTEIPQEGPSNPENSTSPVSSDSFDTYLTKTSAGQATSSTDLYSVTTSAANTRPSRQETPSVPVSSGTTSACLKPSAADLLSESEKQLCRDMGLAPNRYLKIQEELMTQIMRGNIITKKSDAYSLFQLEPTKIDKVYDVLVKKGIAPL